MKKLLQTIFILCIGLVSSMFSQSGAKWSENGDAFAPGAYIGTTNNEPLLLKANNTLGLKIKPNGELIFKSLDLNSNTGPNGIVFTDGQGKIFRLNLNGDGNQILLGNGTWGSSPKTFWLNNGITNDIYFNSGKVGIGTATPQYNLDVIGDARVSNNLYVGGGIVITDRVQASSDVKTQTLNADSILLGAGRSIYGETKVEGDIKAMYKLDVTGDSRFLGKLTAAQGFMLDPSIGFRLLPLTPGQPQTIVYGKVGTAPNPFYATCLTPGAPFYSHQFGGGLQIYETDVNGNYPSAAGAILSVTAWNGATSIDLSGGTSNSSLLIDYFCGRNTLINVGPNGGTVGMGKIVEIGMPTSNSNIAMNIRANNAIGLSIENPTIVSSPNKVVFEVLQDGTTHIGNKKPTAAAFANCKLTVDGNIIAKEIFVRDQQGAQWADYVFEKDYNLMKLIDVESYIKKNKHLPNVPSAKEIEEKGQGIAQLQIVQMEKTEELYLYVIELNKKLEKISNENEQLKQRLDKLNK